MEILITLLGGALGILGAFAGAWFANRYEFRSRKLQEQRDTTIALYTEYQAPEMLKARIKVRNLLTENRQRAQPLSLTELRKTAEVEDWYNISLVITFFEKFGVYLKNNYVDKNLARNLLSSDFRYWYDNYLSALALDEEKLQSEWSKSISHVNEWLTTHGSVLKK